MDEEDLFGAVVEQLDTLDLAGGNASVLCGMEEDGYGDKGYIHIRTGDGRQFALDLYELT